MNTTGNYTTNQGDLTLDQAGEKVNGKYSKTGVLEGSISGNVITGSWKNLGKEGLFEFVFSDNLSFKGKYKIGTEQGTMRSKWDGQITNLNNTEVSKDKTTEEEKNHIKTVSEKKYGIAKWKDEEGNVFDGTWENDILIKGIITYHDGSIEEGEFNEAGLNGLGIRLYKDGCFEKGTFKDGDFIEGTCKKLNEDDLYYEEKWIKGKPIEIISPDLLAKIKFDNGDFYIGEIDPVTRKRYGYGAYIWNDGRYFEGDFVDNKRTGKGIYILNSGSYYVGDFIDGQKNGVGKEWDSKGNRYATGKFVDNIPEKPYIKHYGYSEKNESDLLVFFKTQSRGLDFLKKITSQILEEMPKINCENSNPLLRNISADFQCSVFVYSKNSKYFTSTFDVIKLIKPSVQINLESIFSDISPKMINEISQSELNNFIQENVNSQVITSKQFIIDSLQENIDIKTDLPHIEIIREKSMLNEVTNTDGYHPIVVGSIFFENIDECREDTRVLFMGLGLIEQSIKKRSVHDKETYWKLTEKGNQMMVDIKMKKLM